jgi:hypothetical protein
MNSVNWDRVNTKMLPSQCSPIPDLHKEGAMRLLTETVSAPILVAHLLGNVPDTQDNEAFGQGIVAELNGCVGTVLKLTYESYVKIDNDDFDPNTIDRHHENFDPSIVPLSNEEGDANFAQKLAIEDASQHATLLIKFVTHHPLLKKRNVTVDLTRKGPREVEVCISPIRGKCVQLEKEFQRNGGFKRILDMIFDVTAQVKDTTSVTPYAKMSRNFPTLDKWDPRKHVITGRDKSNSCNGSSVVPWFISSQVLTFLTEHMHLQILGAAANTNVFMSRCLVSKEVRYFTQTEISPDGKPRSCLSELRVKLHPMNGDCWCNGIHQQKFNDCATQSEHIHTRVEIHISCCGRQAVRESGSAKFRCREHYNDCRAASIDPNDAAHVSMCTNNMTITVKCIHERERSNLHTVGSTQWKPFQLTKDEDRDQWTMSQMFVSPTEIEKKLLGIFILTSALVHKTLSGTISGGTWGSNTTITPDKVISDAKLTGAVNNLLLCKRGLTQALAECVLDSPASGVDMENSEEAQRTPTISLENEEYVIDAIRNNKIWSLVTVAKLTAVRKQMGCKRFLSKHRSANILSHSVYLHGKLREYDHKTKSGSRPSKLPHQYIFTRLVPFHDSKTSRETVTTKRNATTETAAASVSE